MGILHERGQFNGAILVARRGTILYRKAFGKANFQTGADFTPETPSNIGSVTKQFTATSIMILEERKKLSYDDPVSKYIPEFSRAAHFSKITLRQLLTHTSGMPDYGDLGIDDSVLDQRGLIATLLEQRRQFCGPRFEVPIQQSRIRVIGDCGRTSFRQAFWQNFWNKKSSNPLE